MNKFELIFNVVAYILVIGFIGLIVWAFLTTPAPEPAKEVKRDYSAICMDGTYSYSFNRQGTCSHHGGVRFWN